MKSIIISCLFIFMTFTSEKSMAVVNPQVSIVYNNLVNSYWKCDRVYTPDTSMSSTVFQKLELDFSSNGTYVAKYDTLSFNGQWSLSPNASIVYLKGADGIYYSLTILSITYTQFTFSFTTMFPEEDLEHSVNISMKRTP